MPSTFAMTPRFLSKLECKTHADTQSEHEPAESNKQSNSLADCCN
jgi:hypothetical protein